MNLQELLKRQAECGFAELLDSIEGLTQERAWAQAEFQPDEYLHSEGSIFSIVVHVASCKFMYGSAGYRRLEMRWRDVIERLESLWPNWEDAKAYLQDAQDYWLASWAGETDFERLVDIPQGRQMPSWKAIWTVTDHDGYHAGQIQVLRATLAPTTTPPADEAGLWTKYCRDLPSY